MGPTNVKLAAQAFLVVALWAGLNTQPILAEQDEDIPTLVRGRGDTIRLPVEMPAKLGIQTAEAKPRVAGKSRILQLNGSTALDPTKITRIRGRAVPFEVIEIAKPDKKTDRTLRAGDWVSKGQILAVIQSADVANKKADLFDATTLLALDEMILERVEKAVDAVPEVFILNAKRNVQTGRTAVTRAQTALKKLGVPDSELEALQKQARALAGNPKADTEEARKARLKEWAKIALTAPEDGVVIECNISLGEVVTDATTNLFTITNPDRLLVIANVREEDLPNLNALKDADRRWSVTAGGTTTVEGTIDEIGYLIDPKDHTAVVKGYIDNKKHLLRAGQFITAKVSLPLAADEIALAATATVEEKGQTFVFVQPDSKKPIYEQRRVVVVRRGRDTVHVRVKLTPEEQKQGFQSLRPGERVVSAGAIDLKALLDDLKGD